MITILPSFHVEWDWNQDEYIKTLYTRVKEAVSNWISGTSQISWKGMTDGTIARTVEITIEDWNIQRDLLPKDIEDITKNL